MTLNCVLLLRLEEIAGRKVVIMLWNRMDILSRIGDNDFDSFQKFTETFDQDVDRVKAKLSQLKLPKLQENKLMPLTKIVGLQIMKWFNFNVDFFKFPFTYFEREKLFYLFVKFDGVIGKLAWTTVGTINYQKTAAELIRCEMFDDFLLFKLACLYCLEDQVPFLWEKLPGDIKACFYDEKDRFQVSQSHLDAFWTNIIRYENNVSGDGDIEPFGNISNFYQHAFEVAAKLGSKAATEYFYEKLTDEEKESSLFKTAEDVATKDTCSIYSSSSVLDDKYTDVLCYLLSQMSPKKQMEFFQAHPYDLSNCFLVWPWQDLFLEVALLSLEYLSDSNYCLLLQDIWTETISQDTKVNLFQEFFRHGPENSKSYFIEQECLDENFLFELFTEGGSEIITCVLRNVEAAAKVRFVFCNQGLRICCYMVQKQQWDLLNLFILEATLSKEDTERLKKHLKSFISEHFAETELLCKFKELERFFSL